MTIAIHLHTAVKFNPVPDVSNMYAGRFTSTCCMQREGGRLSMRACRVGDVSGIRADRYATARARNGTYQADVNVHHVPKKGLALVQLLRDHLHCTFAVWPGVRWYRGYVRTHLLTETELKTPIMTSAPYPMLMKEMYIHCGRASLTNPVKMVSRMTATPD